jgi:zinc transporter ZupT
MLLAICCLTTAIAILSALSGALPSLQRRLMPWTAGMLLGIGVFWILPEMAQARGWFASVIAVSGIVLLLGLVDRYIYPICPFCATGMHGEHLHSVSLGWPLLVVGCLHSFFDGWIIGLPHATALSWATAIHKIPESVAIGLLAARLTSSRKAALGIVALVQIAMALGAVLVGLAGSLNNVWADVSAMFACSLLLLFGLLAAQQEWRVHGITSAATAVLPGLLGCGLFAFATRILSL